MEGDDEDGARPFAQRDKALRRKYNVCNRGTGTPRRPSLSVSQECESNRGTPCSSPPASKHAPVGTDPQPEVPCHRHSQHRHTSGRRERQQQAYRSVACKKNCQRGALRGAVCGCKRHVCPRTSTGRCRMYERRLKMRFSSIFGARSVASVR